MITSKRITARHTHALRIPLENFNALNKNFLYFFNTQFERESENIICVYYTSEKQKLIAKSNIIDFIYGLNNNNNYLTGVL